jgi:hypothetical protein
MTDLHGVADLQARFNVSGYQGGDWDTYLLFGPNATWTSQPTPLRSSGSPVAEQIDTLRQAFNPLLAAATP